MMNEPEQDDQIAVVDDEDSQDPRSPKKRRLTSPTTTISPTSVTPSSEPTPPLEPISPSLPPLVQQIPPPDNDDDEIIQHPTIPPSDGYNHLKLVGKLSPSSIKDNLPSWVTDISQRKNLYNFLPETSPLILYSPPTSYFWRSGHALNLL
jgi:hypothetical protein